jgi:hypothetical protein
MPPRYSTVNPKPHSLCTTRKLDFTYIKLHFQCSQNSDMIHETKDWSFVPDDLHNVPLFTMLTIESFCYENFKEA